MAGRILTTVAAVLFVVSAVEAAKPSPEEIRQAIKDLSDKKFAVRVRASKLLWEAGRDAEAPLREALKSEDAETVRRARAILDNFNWGIFPDTPADVVEQINQFRNGDRNIRLQVVSKLLGMGKPGFSALKRLAEMEANSADKQAIFEKMAQDAQKALPAMLAASDWSAVEDLLDRCLLSGSEEALTNYAAFQALRGRLPSATARAEAEWVRTKTPGSGRLLVHLYRAGGNFPRAREVAKDVSDALLEELLWEEGNWKALSALVKKNEGAARDPGSLGMRAAVHRLAGDGPAFDAALAQLRKLGESDDPYEHRSAAEAMLLIDRPDDALKLLRAKKLAPAMTFDLLLTQIRYKEALDFAAEAKPDGREERFRLDLRVAHALYLLGDRERALQSFHHLSDSLKEPSDLSAVRDLIRTMAQLYLKDQALSLAGRFLAVLQKKNALDGSDQLLESLFDENAGLAVVWWRFLRGKRPDADPEKLLKTVAELLEGKPVEGREAWAEELARQEGGAAPVTGLDDSRPAATPALAAAVVMLQAGREDRAREFFARALQLRPDAATALRYADHLADRGRHQEAAQWYDEAGKLEPANPLPMFLRGAALVKAVDAKEGKRLMDLAHWAPLGSEAERARFAQELDRRGFAADARRERDLVLTVGWYRHWQVGNMLNQAGRQAARDGDFERAMALFEKAIAGGLNKGASYVNPVAYLTAPQGVAQLRVRALLAAKKYDEAVAQARANLAVLPGNVELAIAVVPLLEKAGRAKEADEIYAAVRDRFEALCRDHPSSAYGHNSLAWLAANCGRELDKAMAHAETSVRLEPKWPGYLDTFAEVHFRRGDKAKAIELMNRCRQLDPERRYFARQLARFQKGDPSAPVPDASED